MGSPDTCSFSDDETIIESDQPLFLDATAPVTKNCGDGCAAGEDDAMMAEFLQDTFEPKAVQLSSIGFWRRPGCQGDGCIAQRRKRCNHAFARTLPRKLRHSKAQQSTHIHTIHT